MPDDQVAFLRMALGAAAVPCPQIDVGSGFAAIVKAALGSANMNMTFSPYDNDLDFLLGELHHRICFWCSSPGESEETSLYLQRKAPTDLSTPVQ